SVAKKLAREIPNSYYPNQYDNPSNPEAHYRTTGPEIWEDSEGKITHFVCGMGTGGTISGVAKFLKEKNPQVKIVGVDPEGSLFYDFHKTGKVTKARTYVVEGIGEDFFPTTMDMKILDDVIQVNDEECFVVARRLAKLEGLFTGGSGGGCLSATLRLAKDLGRRTTSLRCCRIPACATSARYSMTSGCASAATPKRAWRSLPRKSSPPNGEPARSASWWLPGPTRPFST